MSLAKPLIFSGGFERPVGQGDLMGAGEIIATLTTAGAGTLTGALLSNNILNRTGPTGAYIDTTDTATNIINALSDNGNRVSQGTSYRLRYLNSVAYAMTLAAGTGVTLAGTTTVAASSVKDYLVQVTNGSPQKVYAATVDGSTAVITGMTQDQTSNLSIGMAVTGTGIAASSVVIGIQVGVGVTLNNNTTAAGTNVALTFSPTVTITGLGQGTL